MATSYGALCNDFYVNQKLAMKMDLPSDRETVLHMFDRVRKTMPGMTQFRRFEDELALESSRRDAEYSWLSLQRSSIRSGHVNPTSMDEAFRLHRMLLEIAPYHLTISALDVDFLELMFGFDLECNDNHDEIVYEALYAKSPLGDMLKMRNAKVLDVQPIFGMSLTRTGDTQCYFEVKTRHRTRRGRSGKYRREPISIFLVLRKYGPVEDTEALQDELEILANYGESLINERLIPNLLMPISRQIASSSA